jgi:hypothetical protein
MDARVLRVLSALASVVALAAGCDLGGDSESRVDEAQFSVEFGSTFEQTVEGQARAGLTPLPRRKTRIVIEMEGESDPVLRAEIRLGTCEVITEGAQYLLNDIKDGESETVVDVPLKELRAGVPGYIIMIRRLSQRTNFTGLCARLDEVEET